jgi:hypothetical protein
MAGWPSSTVEKASLLVTGMGVFLRISGTKVKR